MGQRSANNKRAEAPSRENPLHIGLYSPALPDSGVSNGIVTYTRVMRDALRAIGHSVTIVTTSHVEHADGKVTELPNPRGLIGSMSIALERARPDDGSDPWVRWHVMRSFAAARRLGVDVFEIEESFGWAGRMAGRGVPIIERLHGPHVFGREPIESPSEKKMGDLREIAERKSLDRVQAVTSPSSNQLEALTDLYRLELPFARAIPNPIPLAPSSKHWDMALVQTDQILCVGRFDLRKGADLVLRAFSQALQKRPSMSLVMAGPDTGLMESDGNRVHFVDFVQRELPPEARSRVRFVGQLSPQDIDELRRQSAFALTGSRFENFPYSIAEAMAVGMPVLTSATFGGVEMVRDGIDGRVVPVGDTEAMSHAMVEMFSNRERLQDMGQSCFQRAATWLSPERVARETVKLYREAMLRS